MPGKTRVIVLIIALTALAIALLQTAYRQFYNAFPWSVNSFHTVKYQASLGWIHPDSLTLWIVLTGAFLSVIVWHYHPMSNPVE